MYYGNPAIDRTASSCSASNFRQPRPRPQPRVSGRVAVAPGVADQVLLRQRVEPAYVVRESEDVQSNEERGHGAGCHATPGRRRVGGNAIRILLLVATAFLALTVSPVSGTTSKKEEKMAMASVTEESVAILKTKSNRVKVAMESGMDLLAALELYNTTRKGVSQVPGWGRVRVAYYLQGDERELRLNEASFEHAATLLRQVPEFTIAASVRQEENNSGTIVAFTHGNSRFLELQSSGRKNELRFYYISRRDGSAHVETFPYRIADNVWHKVALSVSGSQVELLVDCNPLYRRLLKPGLPDTNFTQPQMGLWVGQRHVRHFLFKGSMQEVMLVPGPHGFLAQCPDRDSFCPTCGQYYMLQNDLEQLKTSFSNMQVQFAAQADTIARLKECECQKSCRVNGTVHEDGATWEKGCQQCSCVHGQIECRPTPCAPVTCKNPVIPQGQCCPICLKQCYLHGVIYDHGEKVSPKQCVECDCFDGSFTCQRFDTETRCPPLPCPPSEQISVAEECCKFCPGVDYCAKGHKCHANASCLNLQTTYACHCDIGFQGDGHNCHDIDECKQQGGSEGHHCNANTKCVNVIGSYTCECLPGYHRVDKFNCAELDECATGHHACDEHATCVNTAGSYYCICKEGYVGDGYACKPVCNETCQNGGECVAPGKCSCRRGYIGNSCELDLDECASDLHRCHQSSTCFNMPGWYYCRCKPGYRSALHDSVQGTQCLDIDECTDETIEVKHTCHPSAKCVNTEGGYQCVCPLQEDNRTIDGCRLSCWYENREMPNGETVAPPENPCRKCTCKEGVVTCRDPICDCSAPGSHRDKCCPQCDPAASCRHQELHHLVFRSGERWIYQCQTCECLYGEIDCWQMECPPVSCADPVTEDGDCCPRCEDDPCARESFGNGTSLSVLTRPRPCSYSGIIYDSGSSWQDAHDKCTTCECKDGQLCCSYDYGCAGDLGSDEQQQPHPVVVPEPVVRGLPISTGSQMADGSPEAALSPVTVTDPAAAATPITTSYILSAASSSSSVNSRRNVVTGKGYWSLQNTLSKLSQQQQLDHHHHYHQQQQRDDRRVRMQTQHQQPLSTARYQLASGSATTPSSAFERSPSSTSSTTTTTTSATTTSKANVTVKHDTKPQTKSASRRGKVASNNDLANSRSNAFSGFASSMFSSSRSTSTPFAMLGSGSKPAADTASTSSSVVRESVSANSYRESASTVSTASENQGSNVGKSVASRIDTGAT